MPKHPEADEANSLEPTIGEQFRFEEFKRGVEKMDSVKDLREIAMLLAKQALVIQPASIRYLAKEAARNLSSASGRDWNPSVTLALEAVPGLLRAASFRRRMVSSCSGLRITDPPAAWAARPLRACV